MRVLLVEDEVRLADNRAAAFPPATTPPPESPPARNYQMLQFHRLQSVPNMA